MGWLRVICLCLLVGAIGGAFMQKNAISSLRTENQQLHERAEETGQLIRENERIAELRRENQEIAALIEANRELPKLRNDVRQLRELKGEMEKLRLENRRLAAAATSANPRPFRLAETEGYIPNEKWTYGLGSPEATIQTWFLAMREGNWQQFSGAFSPAMQEEFPRQFRMEVNPDGSAKPDEQRLSVQLKEEMGTIARISGYRIATKEQLGQDTVVLGIRAAAGGEVLKVRLRRYGNDWKIDGDPQ